MQSILLPANICRLYPIPARPARAPRAGLLPATLVHLWAQYTAGRRRHRQIAELHRALAQREFRVYYQPIVALATGRISGFEALLRWEHPQRGCLAPGEFLPLAEAHGLLGPISDFVLQEACRQLAAWQVQWPAHALTISVNLSATQLPQPALVERIAQFLQRQGLAPQQLKIEIVESALAPAIAAEATLHALKALGVRLSIDDFGTGYSSLSYLHRFPADTLKIDHSFVQRLGGGPTPTAIIRAIIQLAQSLGMDTVAEGVETASQRDLLTELGCSYGQGWLFAPALSAAEATAFLDPTQLPAHTATP